MRLFFALTLVVLTVYLPSSWAKSVSYQLTADDSLKTFHMNVCFTGFKPEYLESSLDDASRFISQSTQIRATRQGNLKILRLNKDGCLSLTIDVSKYEQSKANPKHFRLPVNSLAKSVDTGLWMWRPMWFPSNTEFRLRLNLPPKIKAALPWPRQNSNTYQVPTAQPFMSIKALFGDFDEQRLNIEGSHLQLAYTHPVNAANQLKVKRWLTQAAEALSQVYGRFPRQHLLILVTDINRATSEATPFAMVSRGEGTVVQFFINQHAPLHSFVNDWTAYHELSHLLIPFVARYHAWASEGLASYYQYLLMGRAGVMSEQDTFKRLLAGIERGLISYQAAPNVKLTQATNNRRKYRSTRRVYWAGALAWFEADLRLRQQGSSLDKVLSQFQSCCLPAHDMWNAWELANQLDQLAGKAIFTPIFKKTAESYHFPDYKRLFAELNIDISNDGVTFNPSELRESFLTPEPTRPDNASAGY